MPFQVPLVVCALRLARRRAGAPARRGLRLGRLASGSAFGRFGQFVIQQS